MGRGNPEPWFRADRKSYFVTIGGKQLNLHTADKANAYKQWHELMVAADQLPQLGVNPPALDLIALFLEWTEKHRRLVVGC